jgi:hypothetical protein
METIREEGEMPVGIGDLEDRLLDELRGMREDFRKVSSDVSALAVEVKHLTEGLLETRGHGERIKALETEVSVLKARDESAATERRWIIGVLVTVGVALLASLIGAFGKIVRIG